MIYRDVTGCAAARPVWPFESGLRRRDNPQAGGAVVHRAAVTQRGFRPVRVVVIESYDSGRFIHLGCGAIALGFAGVHHTADRSKGLPYDQNHWYRRWARSGPKVLPVDPQLALPGFLPLTGSSKHPF